MQLIGYAVAANEMNRNIAESHNYSINRESLCLTKIAF